MIAEQEEVEANSSHCQVTHHNTHTHVLFDFLFPEQSTFVYFTLQLEHLAIMPKTRDAAWVQVPNWLLQRIQSVQDSPEHANTNADLTEEAFRWLRANRPNTAAPSDIDNGEERTTHTYDNAATDTSEDEVRDNVEELKSLTYIDAATSTSEDDTRKIAEELTSPTYISAATATAEHHALEHLHLSTLKDADTQNSEDTTLSGCQSSFKSDSKKKVRVRAHCMDTESDFLLPYQPPFFSFTMQPDNLAGMPRSGIPAWVHLPKWLLVGIQTVSDAPEYKQTRSLLGSLVVEQVLRELQAVQLRGAPFDCDNENGIISTYVDAATDPSEDDVCEHPSSAALIDAGRNTAHDEVCQNLISATLSDAGTYNSEGTIPLECQNSFKSNSKVEIQVKGYCMDTGDEFGFSMSKSNFVRTIVEKTQEVSNVRCELQRFVWTKKSSRLDGKELWKITFSDFETLAVNYPTSFTSKQF